MFMFFLYYSIQKMIRSSEKQYFLTQLEKDFTIPIPPYTQEV